MAEDCKAEEFKMVTTGAEVEAFEVEAREQEIVDDLLVEELPTQVIIILKIGSH